MFIKNLYQKFYRYMYTFMFISDYINNINYIKFTLIKMIY